MTRVAFLLLTFCFISSCRYNAGIVNPDDVTSILISVESRHEVDSTAIQKQCIADSVAIRKIVRELNNCRREPIKFYPPHSLLIEGKNKKVINITCRGDALKDDSGYTYTMRMTIEEILRQK